MKQLALTVFGLIIIVYNCSATVNQFDLFLKDPNPQNYLEWEKSITESSNTCGSHIISNANTNRLFRLVSRGNNLALQSSLLLMSCFKGGTLEDFYRSAGIFFDLKPSVFFCKMIKNSVTQKIQRKILITNPLELTDNIGKKITLFSSRLDKVSSLDVLTCKPDNKTLIRALKQRLEQLKLQKSYYQTKLARVHSLNILYR